jgi:uncharacterized protein DUF6622
LLIEILKHTPSWVFVLFFALVALGYSQSKDRTVRRGRVSILPVTMIALSFYGVLSAFGMVPVGLASWVLGVAVSVGLSVRLAAPQGVSFSAESQSFFVPGSWFPLAFMMAIFFTKYAVGVILARQLPVASEMAFVSSVSCCYGLLSGVFLARAIVIWQAAKSHAETDV